MEILTGEQMRNVDRRAIETMGIASLLLMESAGRGVAEALLEDYPDARDRGVLILCGKGNNGGDGLVVARHLARGGIWPDVVLLARGDELRGDAAVNLRAALASGLEVDEIANARVWSERRHLLDRPVLVLDAILGTGIKGGARGLPAAVIADLNSRDARVIALDLPSGLDGDSTEVRGVVVRAERTYTLCRPKLPIVLGASAAHAGNWSVVPIGIPDSAVREERAPIEWLDDDVARALLGDRVPETHKGTYGHLLAVAGSRGKSGAAVLLARSALRSGVGLMTAAVPAGSLSAVAAQQAELMTEPLPETAAGVLSRGAASRALRLLGERDALAIGPGLGIASDTRSAVLAILKKRICPAVADADALNAIVGEKITPALLGSRRHPLVLTPHPGEAARLLRSNAAKIQSDRSAAALTLARRSGAVVVLKGHRTLVSAPDGRVAVNASGNPGMATAGTGDVLTGMIGAFLARGMEAWDAARLAVFVHGDAGDRAADDRGVDGLIASDLLDRVPDSMNALLAAGPQNGW
jgi:NAD(P)H-hydrate epimerase